MNTYDQAKILVGLKATQSKSDCRCPKCGSTLVEKKGHAKTAGAIVGTAAGAYAGYTGSDTLAGAILGAIIGAAIGGTAGVTACEIIDRNVLDDCHCNSCGYDFSL